MIPKLDIVIVNWNSGTLVSECVKSVEKALNDSFYLDRIVVVDNDSNDDSLGKISPGNLPLTIIKNERNLGFAKASNIGAKNSKADYLLFLNPDTKLFEDSLSTPILFLENEENSIIGIAGIKILDDRNEISRNCARFPNPFSMLYTSVGIDKLFPNIFHSHFMTEWDHNDSRIVDQVMGSFFLIRKNLFTQLKGYDERFFLYYEDLDLANRAKTAGYFSYYLSSASIYHKGGGTTENIKAQRLFLILMSKLKYSKKYFNAVFHILILLNTITIEFLARGISSLIKGSGKDFIEILGAYKKLFLNYRNIVK